MDDMDRAQEINEQHLADCLARLQRGGGRMSNVRAKVGAVRESPLRCVECDELIPEARRKAAIGCTRCIDCQEAQEQRRKW